MIYTIEVFKPLLESMNDVMLRDFTRRCMEAAPAYFWSAPASMSGEYHPPEDRTEGGLVRHSITAAQVAVNLFRGVSMGGTQQDENGYDPDMAKSAGMLHDIAKYGLEEIASGDYSDYENHARIGAEWLRARLVKDNDAGLIDNPDDPDEQCYYKIFAVTDIVRTHMGRWGDKMPQDEVEWAFHFADVAASMPQTAFLPRLKSWVFCREGS